MARYVIFPGTAGSYADTPDINLLDADTAHIQQSIGGWHSIANATAFAVSTDLVSKFGNSELVYQPGSAGSVIASTAEEIAGVPCSPSTEYAVSCWVSADKNFTQTTLRVRDYDAGGVLGTNMEIDSTAIVANEWALLSSTFTTASDAAFIAVQVSPRDDGLASDKFYVSAALLAESSDPTFVPSLRIVGDIDLETKDAVFNPASGTVQWLQTTRAGNGGYGLFINTDGTWGADHGDGLTSRQGIADTTLTAGQVYVLRASMVAGTWTFLLDGVADGIVVNAAGAGVPSGTALSFGQSTTTIEQFQGDGYSGSVRDDGVASGPIVAIFDAEDLGI